MSEKTRLNRIADGENAFGFDHLVAGINIHHAAIVQPLAWHVRKVRTLTDCDDHLVSLNHFAIFGQQPFCSDFLSEDRPADFATESLNAVDLVLVSCRALDIYAQNFFCAHGVSTKTNVHTRVTGTDDNDTFTNLGLFAGIDSLEEIKALGHQFVSRERDHDRIMGT